MIESLELIAEVILFGERSTSAERSLRKRNGTELGPRIPWHLIRYEHSISIRSWLAVNYAPPTGNRHLCALRGVIKECWRMGLMTGDEMVRAVDVPSIAGEMIPAGRYVEPGEIKRLVQNCIDDPRPIGIRDAAMMGVMFGGGLRRDEVRSLDLSDYDPSDGSLKVRKAKGSKQRVAELPAGARRALEAWIEFRGQEPGPMFCSMVYGRMNSLTRLAESAAYKMLERRAQRAGVPAFTPHDGRRTFASDLFESGADVAIVQKLMGHATVNTTVRYDRRPESARRAAIQKLHFPYP